jgi:hypothetical protein
LTNIYRTHPGLFGPLLMLAILLSPSANAVIEWPQEVSADEGIIVVYQPQPESLTGNTLISRAAISLELNDQEEPIFGAMWLSARIDTDHDAGVALVRDIRVNKVRWPGSKDATEQRFTAIVEAAMPSAGLEISLERLSASLANAEIERDSLEDLKHEAPTVIFSQQLAVLLLFDGKPTFSEIDNSPYERALNTPFLVVHKLRSDNYYLGSGDFWYEARNVLGPWQATSNPPKDLVTMTESSQGEPKASSQVSTAPPQIVVATEPTELIATSGKASWKSLQGGELLFVENTETPWLRELSTGNMYILLSGRWYRSKSQQGPWTFVRADELPDSFAAIPPASDIGGLRVSVAGTDEAEEAMLDAAIPQTTAIERSKASLQVEYDGAPQFEDIPGTEVAHAINTGAQVLKIKGHYYAVDQGVWFTSASAKGPWVVADSIPEDEIAKIPPSSPVYNTTHVHIYESSPEVVYVGYTPGYMWSFPYYGVPIYGTGWHYPPYMGRYYYPRPPTWGFHVGYNPWSGWNFGVSWSNGFFSMGMTFGGGYHGAYRPHGCCGGWYGGGYRGPTVINTGDINIGNSVNIGNRTNIRNQVGDNKLNIGNENTLRGRNIYNRNENRTRNASTAQINSDLKKARPASARANDVFAEKNGTLARRKGDDWETLDKGQWSRDPGANLSQEKRDKIASAPQESRDQARDKVAAKVPQESREQVRHSAGQAAKNVPRPSSRPQTRPQVDRQELNRAYHARSSGAARERARPSRQAPRRR